MAFTRQIDDACELKKRNDERYSMLSYLMDPNKYYNNNPSFIPGTVGGNTVSLYSNNMVDLESDLTGRTRGATRCPGGKFLPGTIVQGTTACNCGPECGMYGMPCGRRGCKQKKFVHLPEARMIEFKPTVNTVGFNASNPNSGRKVTARNNVSNWSSKIVPAWTS